MKRRISQALAMRALGQSPAAGVSLSLLIRGRDVLLGVLGLLLAGTLVWWRKERPEIGRSSTPTLHAHSAVDYEE